MKSRHVSRVISASPESVYEFASNLDNLPRWAAGLAQTEVVRAGDVLLVDSPMGKVTVPFVPHNEYGVIDHDVTLPSGTTVTNPVRVLAHPAGSEIVFTIRQIELTDDEFDRDTGTVEQDLERLTQLSYGSPGRCLVQRGCAAHRARPCCPTPGVTPNTDPHDPKPQRNMTYTTPGPETGHHPEAT